MLQAGTHVLRAQGRRSGRMCGREPGGPQGRRQPPEWQRATKWEQVRGVYTTCSSGAATRGSAHGLQSTSAVALPSAAYAAAAPPASITASVCCAIDSSSSVGITRTWCVGVWGWVGGREDGWVCERRWGSGRQHTSAQHCRAAGAASAARPLTSLAARPHLDPGAVGRDVGLHAARRLLVLGLVHLDLCGWAGFVQ